MVYSILILLVIVIVVFLILNNNGGALKKEKYKKFDFLITKVENILLLRIEKALEGTDFKIYCQVALNRIVKPNSTNKKEHFILSKKIGSKSVDYVIVDNEKRIIFAIELDDSSHNSKRAKERDSVKDSIFKAAGLPLMRFHVKKLPDEEQLKRMFFEDELGPLKKYIDQNSELNEIQN